MFDILLKQSNHIDQRNMVMCCYVLGKRKIADDKVWESINQNILGSVSEFTWKNLIIIIYSFSRMKKGDEQLWQELEQAIIKQIERRNKLYTDSTSGVQNKIPIPSRDTAQLLWSFSSLKKGSIRFWNTMEKVLIENSYSFDFLAINKCLFSFYFSEKGSKEFWTFISQQQLNISSKQQENVVDDILFLSKIYQAIMDEKGIIFNFDPLVQKFAQVLNDDTKASKIILESKARISYHQILIEKDKQLQSQKIFELYVQKIKISSETENQDSFLQLYIDFTYMIYELNLQEKFSNYLIEINYILMNKLAKKKQQQQKQQQQQQNKSKKISNLMYDLDDLENQKQFANNQNQKKYKKVGDLLDQSFSKFYSALGWIFHLNINENNSIPNQHKIELLDFAFNNYSIFIESDKKFSQIIQKLLQPLSDKKNIFEFLIKNFESNQINNPIQHLFMIFFICSKFQFMFDTKNLKELLMQPKDEDRYLKEYHNIIQQYYSMFNGDIKFEQKMLVESVLQHFITPQQKLDDIVLYLKEKQQAGQQQQSSSIKQMKKDTQSSYKDLENQQFMSIISKNHQEEDEEKI